MSSLEENEIPVEKTPEVKTSRAKTPRPPEPITKNRVILWVLAGGFALYLIGSGLVGILTR
ncbi:MAG: hypothetical protein ABI400_01545 [Lacisediminihabitans sp.]